MPRPTKSTIESFQHAFDGIWHVIQTQRRMRIHLACTALVLGAGIWVRLSREEWFVVCMAMALVFLADMMDTAIASCLALFESKYHAASDRACQVAAAASLVADAMAIAMLFIIFFRSPL